MKKNPEFLNLPSLILYTFRVLETLGQQEVHLHLEVRFFWGRVLFFRPKVLRFSRLKRGAKDLQQIFEYIPFRTRSKNKIRTKL